MYPDAQTRAGNLIGALVNAGSGAGLFGSASSSCECSATLRPRPRRLTLTVTRPDFRILPEAAPVLAAQARDRTAFAELVRRREAWLRALLRRLTGNAAEADDLAQDVFLRAWRRLHSLRQPGGVRRLDKAAGGKPVHRHAAHRPARDGRCRCSDVASEDVAPDRTAGARIDLERAMTLLTPAERPAITLNLGEGLSHGEVTEATSCHSAR